MTNSPAGTGATRPTLKVMHVAALLLATVMLVGCSREKIDWKSAEAADTVEAYDHFLERHPAGELSTQARSRVAQLNEDRAWKKAAAADTADAYRQFLAQHESGKWAGEARIRVENFALDGTASGPLRPAMDTEARAVSGAATSAAPATVAAATQPAPVSTAAVQPKPVAITSSPPTKPAATTPSAPIPKPVVTASASAPAPRAQPADPATQFGIQLGAFSSQQAALTDWKRIQGRFATDLHGLFARAVAVQQGAAQLFRLQAPVGNESQARAICASLTKQAQPCVVVLPQSR